MKCQVYISRMFGADEGKLVRIDARDGSRLLGRVEISVEDFALAIMGLGAVPAKFSTMRDSGPRPNVEVAPIEPVKP